MDDSTFVFYWFFGYTIPSRSGSLPQRVERFRRRGKLTDDLLRLGGADVGVLRAEADTVSVVAETRGKII
ncbi:hypothetical protein A4G99_05695 [Haladaptatus sp. R4]|nr:hypothetical protein A4G99_05695 [Haladaptatus sp. R4]